MDNLTLEMKLDFCGEKVLCLSNTYPYDTPWDELVGDIVRMLENHYGYGFKLQTKDGDPIGTGA